MITNTVPPAKGRPHEQSVCPRSGPDHLSEGQLGADRAGQDVALRLGSAIHEVHLSRAEDAITTRDRETFMASDRLIEKP